MRRDRGGGGETVKARHSNHIRAGLYAGVALSTLIAAPSFAQQSEAVATAASALNWKM